MVKFRRGHGGETKQGIKHGFIGRNILLTLILSGLLIGIFVLTKQKFFNLATSKPEKEDFFFTNYGYDSIDPKKRYFLPSSTTGELVHHKYYSLSYNEKYEQAEWVSYVLTKESLRAENVKRHDRFDPDVRVKTRSAIYHDYLSSGYTRGHLAPAADMAFNDDAMKESFLMSNISPQKKEFNNGVWNELEENTRNWAWKNGIVYIATGPVLTDNIRDFIGKNRVGIPDYFYKIILDADDPDRKAIGFLLPNEISTEPLSKYAVTIDSIESVTGIDFFRDFLTKDEQTKLESGFDINKWPFNPDLYTKRIEVWNKQ
ncbi:MAG: DNA/RNA non-specific endonuclease [Saprospiraceae bacterium]|nr:DNA/RNA non-specific endonuclease [Saprospiraceae bacterium]